MNQQPKQQQFSPDLSVQLGSLQLENPVIAASGTFGFGREMEEYMDPEQLGAITVKGITVKPSAGNPTPRMAETPSGILNAIGLENPGLEGFMQEKLEIIRGLDNPVIVNISGHSVEDFAVLADRLAPCPEIAALEVNVSCPNIAGGGMVFGTDQELLYRVVSRVRHYYDGPLIVKLSPNVTNIVEMARSAVEGGGDIISLINTLLGMSIDVDSGEPGLANTFGGLSGPAIKPVALHMVYQVAAAIEVPLIGIGGIMNGRDALEFIMAGATAVGVGTATLTDPGATVRIIGEIEDYLVEKKIYGLEAIRGKALEKGE
ncbi:MAG: dihydroorotate dehydrogenase [Bacillota bacterium]